jgi:hypothetical protein
VAIFVRAVRGGFGLHTLTSQPSCRANEIERRFAQAFNDPLA